MQESVGIVSTVTINIHTNNKKGEMVLYSALFFVIYIEYIFRGGLISVWTKIWVECDDDDMLCDK